MTWFVPFTTTLRKYMPILEWLPAYNLKQNLKSDFIAALTVAVMLIPQEMSLTSLMGVPIQNGFYTAAIAPMVYPCFGSSPSASIANTAEGSLLVSVMLQGLQAQTIEERESFAILLAFFSGCFMILGGVFQVGYLVNYFSRTSMNAYVNATCIMIILSQIAPWFGIPLPNTQLTIFTLVEIVRNGPKMNVYSFFLGLFSVVFLLASKAAKKHLQKLANTKSSFRIEKAVTTCSEDDQVSNSIEVQTKLNDISNSSLTDPDQDDNNTIHHEEFLPAEPTKSWDSCSRLFNKQQQQHHEYSRAWLAGFLFLCDTSSLLVCIFGIWAGFLLGKERITITGAVDSGLPIPRFPWQSQTLNSTSLGMDRLVSIVVDALVIALVFFMSSMAITQKLALKKGDEILPNQEFLGLGFANLVASFFQGTPASAGMSRSAVNAQHSLTPLASMITSWIVMVALLCLTRALYFLPKAPLCAMIIVATVGILDFSEWKRLCRINKRQEAKVWWISFCGTLMLGLLRGLVFSVACSSLLIMLQSTRPHVVRLGISFRHGNELQTQQGSESSSSSSPRKPTKSTTMNLEDTAVFLRQERDFDAHGVEFVELQGDLHADLESVSTAIVDVEAQELPEVLVVRVQQSLYFGNCARVIADIEQLLVEKQTRSHVVGIVIDGSRINDMDATSLGLLQDFQAKLLQKDSQPLLAFANTTLAIHKSLVENGFKTNSSLATTSASSPDNAFTRSIAFAVETIYASSGNLVC